MMHNHMGHGCASPLKFRYSEKATKIWNYHPLSFDIKYLVTSNLEVKVTPNSYGLLRKP